MRKTIMLALVLASAAFSQSACASKNLTKSEAAVVAESAAVAAQPTAVPAAVTPAAAKVDVPTPGLFNSAGNWNDSAAVKAQEAAYKAAHNSEDVNGMLQNAFWTSVQGWALNNAGHRKLQAITEGMSSPDTKAKAREAKDYLQAAIDVVNATPEISNAHETEQRRQVLAMATKNLVYAKRLLGELPWPKAEKTPSSDPEAAAAE